jgi:hypothetical protein
MCFGPSDLFNVLIRFDCSAKSDSDPTNIFTIMLIVESALFGLFTLCMMFDQSSVVITNQTQIDRLKNVVYSPEDVKDVGINEVFGCPADARYDSRCECLAVRSSFDDAYMMRTTEGVPGGGCFHRPLTFRIIVGALY